MDEILKNNDTISHFSNLAITRAELQSPKRTNATCADTRSRSRGSPILPTSSARRRSFRHRNAHFGCYRRKYYLSLDYWYLVGQKNISDPTYR